ncbi:MAG: 3-dehydroquinate synthase [Candidatus Eisenbacteria bacterium]|uniref:3-dehydroquinate synthase n=1 Tax=Eiseniibacteriota bacterium TaxID=2212470 RepID=A0A538TY15_UNCEI|nr:MAG: 3-dehydroquinate synthase [Candidatus Eisenbacteria bacterium]
MLYCSAVALDLLVRYPGRSVRSRIQVRRGALDRLGACARAIKARRVAVVSDATVAALYGGLSVRSLERAGLTASLVTVPPGERAKNPRQLVRLWGWLGALGLTRGDAVVALGGGVVGDLAGFAAATWLRGVAWIGVPTSLVAQIDSCVGGKTAVDLEVGKNLVGAFHQPVAVLVDPDALATLPERHHRAGLAELVKLGMAVDGGLFAWTERHARRLRGRDGAVLEQAVARAIRVKARVVRGDERERWGGARTALNYGHTLGHALESACGYRGPLHGEAVAIGMRAAAAISTRVAGLSAAARARQDALLDAFGLPRRVPPVALEDLLRAMRQDKKRGAAEVRWVLTPRVGHASVPRPVDRRLVRSALIEIGARV